MLTMEQSATTRDELAANLALSGMTVDELATRARLSPVVTRRALRLDARPEFVWQLRDVLEQSVRAAGGRPVAYTVLTESARAAAESWFPLRRFPSC